MAYIDCSSAVELYADGVLDVEVIGSTARIVLFRYRRSEKFIERAPVACLFVPVEAIEAALRIIKSGLAAAVSTPTEYPSEMGIQH